MKIDSNDFFSNWLKMADERIRVGQGVEVASEMRQIGISQIPRIYKYEFARIALRTGQNYWGLKILNKLVHPDEPQEPASETEKLIYAALLTRVGATREGQEILKGMDSKIHPEALLYQAHTEVFHWNYRRAAKFYREYVRHSSVTPYQRLVGNLNLGACYLGTRKLRLASRQLRGVIREAVRLKSSLLHGNALELLGQVELELGNYSAAREALDQALTILKNSNPRYLIYVKKWQLILSCLEEKNQGQILSPMQRERLQAVKKEAEALREWESIRDCEFFEAVLFDDKVLQQHIYWGTPYATYRVRMKSVFGMIDRQGEFIYGNTDAQQIFDVAKGSWAGANKRSIPRPKPLRLLRLLLEDFYKPIPVGEVHDRLYPKEFFNPISSPKRISFIIEELRRWMEHENLPVDIIVKNKEIKLHVYGSIGFAGLTDRSRSATASDSKLEKLKTKIGAGPFSIESAANILSLSLRQTRRVLAEAVAQKLLKKDKLRPKLFQFRETN